jgi:molecular chaperone GrpE
LELGTGRLATLGWIQNFLTFLGFRIETHDLFKEGEESDGKKTTHKKDKKTKKKNSRMTTTMMMMMMIKQQQQQRIRQKSKMISMMMRQFLSSSSSSLVSRGGGSRGGGRGGAGGVASFSNRSNFTSSSSSSFSSLLSRRMMNNDAPSSSSRLFISSFASRGKNTSSRCVSTTSLARNTQKEGEREQQQQPKGDDDGGKNNSQEKKAATAEGDGATGGGKEQEEEQNEQEQNEMAEKDALIVELNERHLRTLADMENLRTRTQRQNEDAKKFAVQGFAKDLLDVADNMDRACATVTEEIIAEAKNDAGKLETLLRSFKEGVELTQRQLSSGFKKNGLVKFDPVDEPFDANEHMALFNVPVGETKKEPGSVAVVTKAGYRLHDRVVRAAEVGVYQ